MPITSVKAGPALGCSTSTFARRVSVTRDKNSSIELHDFTTPHRVGGTGFCDLAKRNLKRGETPPYYCMVDRKGSLATHPWNQETKVLSALRAGGGRGLGAYRMTSNEWDVYERRMGAWEGAVLATTFRHPVDR